MDPPAVVLVPRPEEVRWIICELVLGRDPAQLFKIRETA